MSDDDGWEYVEALDLMEEYLRQHPDQEPYREKLKEHARKVGTLRRRKPDAGGGEDARRTS